VSDLDDERRAEPAVLREAAGAVRSHREVVRVVGEDATSFLQGQLSQDVTAMAAGECRQTLLLEPGGRVEALLRVWSVGGDEYLLEVDGGAGQAVLVRLDRFRLRVRAELEVLTWSHVAVRGPSTPASDSAGVSGELKVVVDWGGVPGLDVLGPSAEVQGVPSVEPAALEGLRIEAGVPAMGSEFGPDLEPLVIPAEAGTALIDDTVSFTKGCYVGQELVARVDSRGSNTPRKLRGIVIGGDEAPVAGAEVLVDGVARGSLTSVGWSPALGAPVALAYLHRSVEPGARATVRLDGATEGLSAEVRDLPLVGA
jgi:tRNA-modifying protein YgfZ